MRVGEGVVALEGRAGEATESGGGRISRGMTVEDGILGCAREGIVLLAEMAGSRIKGALSASLGAAKSCTSCIFNKTCPSLLALLAS